MHQIDILNTDWPEVEAIAKHLGRQMEACLFHGNSSAICYRNKVTDRQYHIIKTNVGFLTVMDFEDLNYIPKPILGRFYWVKFSNTKIGEIGSLYLCRFNCCLTKDSFKVTYQLCNDNKEPLEKAIDYEFKEDQVMVVSFEPANVTEFFNI